MYSDVPTELMKEHLLSLPIEDIIKCRLVSKEFKSVIDDSWFDLLRRDYPDEICKKKNYQKRYKVLRNKFKYMPKITLDQAKDNITIIEEIGFKKYKDAWYWDPQQIFKSDLQYILNMSCFTVIKYNNGLFQNVHHMMKDVLSRVFMFDYWTDSIYITYYDFFTIYENVYGKGSFDKEFLSRFNELLYQRKISISPDYYLSNFKNKLERQLQISFNLY